MTAVMGQFCWISLQPIPGAIESGYGKGNNAIAFIGLIFVIVFIPMNFPSNFIIDKGGLKLGVSRLYQTSIVNSTVLFTVHRCCWACS